MARVSAGARLHVGFQNLSLAHERLYGGVGVALAEPRVTVDARRADGVDCADSLVADFARRSCDCLGLPGAAVTVEERLPRHVGLGSGTQLALATLAAVAGAYDRDPNPREHAPDLGRGGRSGVGVAGFETGGFVVDAGHPTEQFTTERPADGEWTVPPVLARHDVPDDWRFLVVVPDASAGRSGDDEDASMRTVVDRADPAISDDLATLLVRRVLPAVAAGRLDDFGAAVAEFGRLNGAWYADEQGGVYRPSAGAVIARLRDASAVSGVGQSSWGPAVYGVTDTTRADGARLAAERALEATGWDGTVLVTPVDDSGARLG